VTRSLPCRGLLFDSDGVLVDSDASVELSWTRWAHRWDLDADEVMAVVHGRRSADTVARLIDHADRARAQAEIDRYEVEDATGVTACPGARELLLSLPHERWAVVTSGRRDLLAARLVVAELPTPGVLVTADDIAVGKPDPAGYLRAAEGLGLSPANCVVFEDSPAGVAAGLAAGAVVVGVSERALDTGASVVVRDLRGVTWDDGTLHLPEDRLRD
jgi:sugar-phosphatase